MAKGKTIRVVEYTKTPGPRYKRQGTCSGEAYYSEILQEAFKDAQEKDYSIVIDLDGTVGYTSSFLDEALGRLIYDFGKEEVSRRVSYISKEEPEWLDMLNNETYIQWEKRRENKEEPKNTDKDN